MGRFPVGAEVCNNCVHWDCHSERGFQGNPPKEVYTASNCDKCDLTGRNTLSSSTCPAFRHLGGVRNTFAYKEPSSSRTNNAFLSSVVQYLNERDQLESAKKVAEEAKPKRVTCSKCHGRGRVDCCSCGGLGSRRCSRCEGTGGSVTRLEMREASKVFMSRMRYLPNAEIDSAFYGFDKDQGCWSSEMMKSTFRHVICKKSVSCDVAAKSEKHIQEALRIDAKTGFGGDGEGLAVTHGAVFDKFVSMCSEIDEKAAEWEGSNVSRIKEAAVEIWESECIAQVEFKDALGFPRRAFVNLANQKVHLCDVAAEAVKPVLEKLTRQACDGDVEMQNVLGQIYAQYPGFKSLAVEKDCEIAAAWFLRAAKGGCADAMDNLGNCLKNGDGVEKDVELAFAWYRKSAKKGLATAMRHLQEGPGA